MSKTKRLAHKSSLIEVPIDLRLQIYREAKTYLSITKYKDYSLRSILPMVLWYLKDLHDTTPSGESWTGTEVHIAFPEYTSEVDGKITQNVNPDDRLSLKLEFIDETIDLLEFINVEKLVVGVKVRNNRLDASIYKALTNVNRNDSDIKRRLFVSLNNSRREYRFLMKDILINDEIDNFKPSCSTEKLLTRTY